MNVKWTSGSTTSELQVYVSVNERSGVSNGDSCFGVEYFPNINNPSSNYYYAFGIGYSAEFYSSTFTAPYFTIAMSSSTVSYMTVYVQNDGWIIYTSSLCNSSGTCNPTITIPSSGLEEFAMVGNCCTNNVNFNGAGGNMTYSYITWNSNNQGAETYETSNMVYNSPSCTQSSEQCTQSYHEP